MTSKLLDRPLEGIILWDIYSVTSWGVKGRAFHIFWDGYKDIDVVGDASFFIIAFDFHDESDPGV